MAGRDIKIPFGPDKTGGIPLDAIPAENDESLVAYPFAETPGNSLASSLPNPMDGDSTAALPSAQERTAAVAPADAAASLDRTLGLAPDIEPITAHATESPSANASASAAAGDAPSQEAPLVAESARANNAAPESVTTHPAAQDPNDPASDTTEEGDYLPGGYTEEEAAAEGMDEMQMSILALKDSIGQGRELKEREKERQELAEALEADHIELADREDILANYQSIVAEQDALIADYTQKREAAKNELAQLTMSLGQANSQLEALREQHAQHLKPLETELGRARAAADQAKNDERSRKSELNAAESELRKAADSNENMMAVAQHRQVKAAYEEARSRSEQAKEQLAEIQKSYDDMKSRSEQAQGPLKRSIEDFTGRIESLKTDISSFGDELSAAMNRRQYCDTVYQYPDETARMRAEVEEAEALARQMDKENDVLRSKLAQSTKRAFKAKLAIGAVILIVIVFIVSFIILSGR